ncbi:MAG TPA: hypothetical protein VKB88_21430 [Bryobacteraceae bacterium]|nr:hypothetical protein [Bryobacteraceae bacterium]
MAEPRYSQALQQFIHDWRPNDPELDKRFLADIKELLAAILKPPASVFEVNTILSSVGGGKVVLRLGEYEAQMDPLDAQHLALSLMEGASAARLESMLSQFFMEKLGASQEHLGLVLAHFRHYRIEEMQKELDGEFAKRGVIPPEMP